MLITDVELLTEYDFICVLRFFFHCNAHVYVIECWFAHRSTLMAMISYVISQTQALIFFFSSNIKLEPFSFIDIMLWALEISSV